MLPVRIFTAKFALEASMCLLLSYAFIWFIIVSPVC